MRKNNKRQYDDFGVLTDIVCSDIELLFDDLGIEMDVNNDQVTGPCHIHSSDNGHSFIMYLDGHTMKGTWRCWSASCQNTFCSSLIGYVRGFFSAKYCRWSKPGDKMFSFWETVNYLKQLYGINCLPKYTQEQLEERKFAGEINTYARAIAVNQTVCSREKYLRSFTEPAEYFLKRGFTPEILDLYDVRYYPFPRRKFTSRCIIPQYDAKARHVVGITARTTDNTKPKWLHSDNFPASTSLYNLWRAGEYVRRSHGVVLVESPCCVWRLEEAGIRNAVGVWGGQFQLAKASLLDWCSLHAVTLCMDMDEPGRRHAEAIISEWRHQYRITEKLLPDGVNDVAEMPVEDVQKLFRV